MNFELTDEQIQVRDMVREFAQREVAPYIQQWEARGEFHREVLDKMGELGILVGVRLQMLRDGSPCLLLIGGGRLSLRGGADVQVLVQPVAHE